MERKEDYPIERKIFETIQVIIEAAADLKRYLRAYKDEQDEYHSE